MTLGGHLSPDSWGLVCPGTCFLEAAGCQVVQPFLGGWGWQLPGTHMSELRPAVCSLLCVYAHMCVWPCSCSVTSPGKALAVVVERVLVEAGPSELP